MEKQKEILTFLTDRGNIENPHYTQNIKVEYLPRVPGKHITGMASITITMTGNIKEGPRSFRTNNPGQMRSIIKAMCQALYRLEAGE